VEDQPDQIETTIDEILDEYFDEEVNIIENPAQTEKTEENEWNTQKDLPDDYYGENDNIVGMESSSIY
jgi:hypothetical protein